MNIVSGTILLALLLTVCFAQRRWALLAIMVGVFFLTQGHSINLAGFNVYPVRFLEAAAFARVLLRRELCRTRLNRIDWTLLILYNYVALVWLLRSGNFEAQQFAYALDPTLCYLALRGLMRSPDEFRWLLYALVALLVPFTILVFVERFTGSSPFALVGGSWTLYVRNGVVRCQGSFRHAILMGSVAASFLSLYVGLSLGARKRAVPVLGAALCLMLVLMSNSGGPLTSALVAFAGWLLWPVRRRMRLVRWLTVGLLFAVAIFMKAPIWYLPFKISAVVGGGGFHRGLLMDQASRNLDKWYLTGMDIKDTADWFPYILETVGGSDVTNQFLVFGLKAGLAALVLSLTLLVFAFKALGRALSAPVLARKSGRSAEALLWGLGVMLAVHAVSWLGVSYYDQSWVIWLTHLAAICVYTSNGAGARATQSASASADEGQCAAFVLCGRSSG